VTTLAHISDLHFGAETRAVVDALVTDVRAVGPDLLVVSGDLTQRGRRAEFVAARAFLDRFDCPKLAVPGNHDIPLFDLFTRFFRPLARFRRYIAEEVDPFFANPDLAVLGINTARSNTWKDGRVGEDQIQKIRRCFAAAPRSALRVLVTHHPFMPSPREASPPLVGRAAEALEAAEASKVDLLLNGHLHHGFVGDIRAHHETVRRSILVVQAGTATSHRTRGEQNSYNVIQASGGNLRFARRVWDGTAFREEASADYRKDGLDWRAAAEPPP
jgi:3',5'-cyclic AMP phosphodiesterase CpdA